MNTWDSDGVVETTAVGVKRAHFGPITVDFNPDGSASLGNGVCLWGDVALARATAVGLLTGAEWIEQERADLIPPKYPGTKALTLCTLDGRLGGQVTVGQHRLPLSSVLTAIRERGVAETRIMWPHLSDDDLVVLERLAADLGGA